MRNTTIAVALALLADAGGPTAEEAAVRYAYAEAEAARGALETFGYDGTFRGFGGGHEIPAGVAAEIGEWLAE